MSVTFAGGEVAKCATQPENSPAVHINMELVATQSTLRAVIRKGGMRRQLVGAKKQNKMYLSTPEVKCLNWKYALKN